MRAPTSHCLLIHAFCVASLAALTVGWFAIGVRPLMTETQRASLLADQATAHRDAIHERVVRREERDRRRADIERELAGMSVRLRPASAVNAQLAEITRLAESHRIVVDRIEPGTAVDTPLAIRVPMRFAGVGRSPDAVRFLAALRAGFPDIAVEGFEVSSRAGDTVAAIQFDCVWYADRGGDRKATAAASP